MKNVTAICRAAMIGALAAASVPAMAGEPAGTYKQKLTYDAKTGKYCAKEALTGSRMEKSICRTREQWVNQGVVIPEKSETEMAKK